MSTMLPLAMEQPETQTSKGGPESSGSRANGDPESNSKRREKEQCSTNGPKAGGGWSVVGLAEYGVTATRIPSYTTLGFSSGTWS